jgi:uncharacterized damage-inducible protein DinB
VTTSSRGDVRPPDLHADEKTTLLTFLDYLRESVVAKVVGLADDVARRELVPSGTSLSWLLKHLTVVELGWFVWGYAGEDLPFARHDERLTGRETVADLVSAYRAAVHRANQVVAACTDLDRPGVRTIREGDPPNMRWVLVHMIEETARHAGHADIIREQIDGSVGR